MREAPNCAEKCEKRLIVRICAGNGLKCENVRETAKSAIPHPPHFIFASDGHWAYTLILILLCLQNAQNIIFLMEPFLYD